MFAQEVRGLHSEIHQLIKSGLLIREPWIDLILAGDKTWEMRSFPTRKRETIALVKSGSGKIFGTARIVTCHDPLIGANYMDYQEKHQIPSYMLDLVSEKNWVFPWELAEVLRFAEPIPYKHRPGAVHFVTLDADVSAKVLAKTKSGYLGTSSVSTKRLNQIPADQAKEVIETYPAVQTTDKLERHASAGGYVTLTQGNINNGHFYLHSVTHLIPSGGIGGANKSDLGVPFTVQLDGNTFITDVAGDKMILRKRVGAVLKRIKAKAGDRIAIDVTGPREWNVKLIRQKT